MLRRSISSPLKLRNRKQKNKYYLFGWFPFQDRATFHRLIVRNNAKKRRMYEAFIECVPLLKSLEVCIET